MFKHLFFDKDKFSFLIKYKLELENVKEFLIT
jgi:hypothetical protein